MIGARIRQFRKSKNMKVAEFAALIGISQGSLSDIENEKTKPSAETLSSIIRHTDIDAAWLMTGEGGMVIPVASENREYYEEIPEPLKKTIDIFRKNPEKGWEYYAVLLERADKDEKEKKKRKKNE